ncbi:hypothetical protein [Cognatishimia sp. F0-27]|uniref:hypothetical protein n=1 Tax=Cognatishimia sp. F0-27 TaxID=2816855 RepID=UPI001D0CD7B1|nr:hypothetical protein [Cognatishimia sp. F0-27]MCC1491853.1 hypothetical protein [Cognatishimia sp. F0-27]
MPEIQITPAPEVETYNPWVGGPARSGSSGDVVALPSGGFFSAWAAGSLGVRGRFHDNDGQAINLSGVSINTPGNSISAVDLIYEASGTILAVFGGNALSAVRISSDGSAVTDLGMIASPSNRTGDFVLRDLTQVAPLNDGGFALRWGTLNDGERIEIFNADGSSRTVVPDPDYSAALTVFESGASVEQRALVTFADGTLGVVSAYAHRDQTPNAEGFPTNLFLQRVNDDGTLNGAVTRLSDTLDVESFRQVVVLSDDRLAVAGGTDRSLEIRVFDPAGGQIGETQTLTATDLFDNVSRVGPSVTFTDMVALDDGGFVVQFDAVIKSTSSVPVPYVMLMDATGRPANDPVPFGAGATDNKEAMAVLSNGSVVAYEAIDEGGFQIFQFNSLAEGQIAVPAALEPVEDEALTWLASDFSPAGLVDADGVGDLSEARITLWRLNAEGERAGIVASQNQNSFTPTDFDGRVGTEFQFQFDFLDDAGNPETVFSSATAPTRNTNDAPTEGPILAEILETGTIRTLGSAAPLEGRSLTIRDGLGALDPDNESWIGADAPGVTLQWFRDGEALPGETGLTLALAQEDVGATYFVQMTYVDDFGTRETVESAVTAPLRNFDDPLTGLPRLADPDQPIRQFDTVTVDGTDLSDADGIDSIQYQFIINGVGFSVFGESDSLLLDSQSYVGQELEVIAHVTDAFGNRASTDRVSLGTIENVNDAPEGAPLILGDMIEDATLRLDVRAVRDPDGLNASTRSYQWLRDGVAIEDATGTSYQLEQSDVGRVITVRYSFTDLFGTAESVTSLPGDPVENIPDAPTGTLRVVGDFVEDATLRVDASTIEDADGLGAFSYQWFRGADAIPGATQDSYVAAQDDVGAQIFVEISYTDGAGDPETIRSENRFESVQNVDDPVTGTPVILGDALEETLLTSDLSSIEDPDGITSVRYQWFQDGVSIGGATLSEFRPREEQIGRQITLEVTIVDAFFNTTVLESEITAPIEAIPRVIEGTAESENLRGNNADDTLGGGAGFDTLTGGRGNDLLDGGNDDDVLDAGDGSDTLNGGNGNDALAGGLGDDALSGDGAGTAPGNDTLEGGPGNDTLNGNDGDDEIFGGQGFDVADGGAGDDTLTGLNGFDSFAGGAGNDLLIGNFGNDTLDGGAGNDTLEGGLGFDVLRGDADDDFIRARDGFDTLDGGTGADSLQGNNGNDSLSGGDGNDLLQGGLGADTLAGDAGDDTLEGANGFDVLNGGSGRDQIVGGAGNDTLDGGADNDTLRGGIGADTFVFSVGSGSDQINDFQNNIDAVRIDADLLSAEAPTTEDLRALATVVDGNLTLAFEGGTTLTFLGFANVNALLDDVTLV